MKQMRIRIGKDGKVRLAVEGATGSECLDFTRLFEQAVGEVEKREMLCEGQEVKETVREETQEKA